MKNTSIYAIFLVIIFSFSWTHAKTGGIKNTAGPTVNLYKNVNAVNNITNNVMTTNNNKTEINNTLINSSIQSGSGNIAMANVSNINNNRVKSLMNASAKNIVSK